MGMISRLFPRSSAMGEFPDERNPWTGATTPELCSPSRRRPQLPAFAFRMVCHNEGIVGNFLRDERHSRVLEGLSKHGVAEDRQRRQKLITSSVRLQSLSTAPESRMRIARHGKSGNVTHSFDRICVLSGLCQEAEVFEFFSSPL